MLKWEFLVFSFTVVTNNENADKISINKVMFWLCVAKVDVK